MVDKDLTHLKIIGRFKRPSLLRKIVANTSFTDFLIRQQSLVDSVTPRLVDRVVFCGRICQVFLEGLNDKFGFVLRSFFWPALRPGFSLKILLFGYMELGMLTPLSCLPPREHACSATRSTHPLSMFASISIYCFILLVIITIER
jgi:hypothetical protein